MLYHILMNRVLLGTHANLPHQFLYRAISSGHQCPCQDFTSARQVRQRLPDQPWLLHTLVRAQAYNVTINAEKQWMEQVYLAQLRMMVQEQIEMQRKQWVQQDAQRRRGA